MTTVQALQLGGGVVLLGATCLIWQTPRFHRWRNPVIYLDGGYASGVLFGLLTGGPG